MLPITSYVLVGITIVCAGVCFSVAKKKGINTRLWVVLGALFGPFALPFVFLAKPRNRQSRY
ncbi:MAG: hypothetical protein P8N51_13225, partial [Pseudomonadales bacterium]|jgi:hypothetical protein|nr:hypothetical protein [Pseudomonadales bacterium]